MTSFDLSRLGAWADLAFFRTDWPSIEAALAKDPGPIYPPRDRIFAALERSPPDLTRVVILGQDPYHTPGKADGLAFSIPQSFGGRLDSLGNIFKELRTDLNVDRQRTDLSDWADQGVLLLNTALTVPEGKAHGHAKLGWRALVDQILARLDSAPRAFLLWGKPAQALGAKAQNPEHLKLETAHPSPLSAHRGFFGAQPFSKVNAWLDARGLDPIQWAETS